MCLYYVKNLPFLVPSTFCQGPDVLNPSDTLTSLSPRQMFLVHSEPGMISWRRISCNDEIQRNDCINMSWGIVCHLRTKSTDWRTWQVDGSLGLRQWDRSFPYSFWVGKSNHNSFFMTKLAVDDKISDSSVWLLLIHSDESKCTIVRCKCKLICSTMMTSMTHVLWLAVEEFNSPERLSKQSWL